MRLRSTTARRSARSGRTAPTSIPFRIMHRRKLTIDRPASVYSARLTLPSPVTARHRESDNHPEIPDRLSRATTHEPAAAVTHDSASRGACRKGTGDGSIRSTIIRVAVLLALPCSANSASIGCGQSLCTRVATSVAIRTGRSSSATLTKFQSKSRFGWLAGMSISPVNFVRKNLTGADGVSDHLPSDIRITWPSNRPVSM